LRPTLVALAARCFGEPTGDHVKAAVIIEMIHLATLVHDDVMDEAEIRRGNPTLAAKWGNEIAVLFGDCLLAQALKLASSHPTMEFCRAVSQATTRFVPAKFCRRSSGGSLWWRGRIIFASSK
jgi:octaprenyl-diphosphate synthase